MLPFQPPEGLVIARDVVLAAYAMTGQRYGLGLLIKSAVRAHVELYPVSVNPSVAAVLFPGFGAVGREYADLDPKQIER